MRTWLVLMMSLLALLGARTDSPAADAPKRVYIIPIREDIESPLVYVIRRGVKEAMAAKAQLLVLDMDTDGGRIDATLDIIHILNEFKGETVTYVNTKAFSAGSFISVATQKIYMAPESVIGAAAPVMLAPGGQSTQDLPSTVEVKEVSAVRALVRTCAEKNGYNVDVVEAMIDKNKELTVDGVTLNKKGDLLTLTSSEAEKTYGKPPKPLLSSGTVSSLDDLLKKLGYADAQVTRIQPSGAEKFAAWINVISPLLLVIGLIGIYIEFKTPGVFIPGIVAAVAFLLYFFGGYVAGLSGMEWIVVFIIGMALVISEFFVHPGTVLPGVCGVALILIALVMAMVDVYPGGPMLPSLPQVRWPLEELGIALITSLVIMGILARVLPSTPVYRTLVSHGASGVSSIAKMEKEQESRLGQTGVAISNLRPGGKAQFGRDVLDVITRGEMIAKGESVRIIGSSGSDALVEAA
ncbi:MAG TPA: ATP-dependent Clp protease proteolytic subunit [Verrucomicrobiae bacterium]|nr:ATP-dependent Clp protease proteolytic subunit [Verrucomicrobiae bacterium]